MKWTGTNLHYWQIATNGARRTREWVLIGLFFAAIALALLLAGCNVYPADDCAAVRAAVGYTGDTVTDQATLLDANGRAIGTATHARIAECVNLENAQ